MRNEFGKRLLTLAGCDERIYVLDGDLANSTKIDIIEKEMPKRFIQTGIAEQNMIGIAAGLASTGIQPWVTTFTSFLTKRALDQIIVSIAQPRLDVKLIGSYSGILNSRTGKTHQGIEDIAIMRTIPNMIVLAPADGYELQQMMMWANKYDGPVYIRIAREAERVLKNNYIFDVLEAKRLLEGNKITIISTGSHLKYAEEAAIELGASLIHMPTIKPIDKNTIIDASNSSDLIVTIEDHLITGGLGSAVAEVLCDYAPCKMLRIGIDDKNIESGSNEELLDKYELSTEKIISKIKNHINKV